MGSVVKLLIDKLCWTFPYRWIDEWQKNLQLTASTMGTGQKEENVVPAREWYILGWFGLSIVFLIINQGDSDCFGLLITAKDSRNS